MSRNKFIQDVVWVLILALYPNLLNVSFYKKKQNILFLANSLNFSINLGQEGQSSFSKIT